MKRATLSRTVALFLLAPSLALANATALPDTVSPALRPGDASRIGVEANFGFLESIGGGPWTWSCHETMVPGSSSVTPLYFEGPGELTLATTRSLGVANDPTASLYRTTDGCNWSPVAGLTNVLIRDVAFDPSNSQHLLAASSTGAGANNGVWVSNDGGASWAKTSLDLPQRFFRTVRWAPNDPLVVYAAGTWYMPAGSWIYRSDDGGATWTEYDWVVQPLGPSGPTLTQLDLVAISPTSSSVIWVRTDYTTNYLLRSTNGGATFAYVFDVAADIRGVSYDENAEWVWIGAGDAGTWRTLDAVSFEEVVTAPSIRGDPQLPYGLALDSRGMFAAANNYADGMALGVLTVGTGFTPVMRFEDLTGPKACPAGSHVTTICGPLWPALAQRLGIATPSPTPSPSGDDDDDDGCSCGFPAREETRSFPRSFFALVAAAGALLLLVRRR